MNGYQGLKPLAESCSPFGTKSDRVAVPILKGKRHQIQGAPANQWDQRPIDTSYELGRLFRYKLRSPEKVEPKNVDGC